MPFKVGDRVRIIDHISWSGYWHDRPNKLGDFTANEYTIKAVSVGPSYVLEEINFTVKGKDGWFIDGWFERIEIPVTKKVKKVKKVAEVAEPEVVVGVHNLPLGRIGKVDTGYPLYVARMIDTEILRIWPSNAENMEKGSSVQSMHNDEGGSTWKIELLPIGTQISFTFNGKEDWQ